MSTTENKEVLRFAKNKTSCPFMTVPCPLTYLLVVIYDFEEFNAQKNNHMFLPGLLKWNFIHSQFCKREDSIITALTVFFFFHI